MRYSVSVRSVLLCSSLLALVGCSSGSSDSSTTTATSDAAQAKSLSAVELDLSNVDVSKSSASADESLPPGVSGSVAKGFGTTKGDACITGCIFNQTFDEMIRGTKGVAMFQCYYRAMESATPPLVSYPESGAFKYYTIEMPAGKVGLDDAGFKFKLRVSRTGGDSPQIKADICESDKQTLHINFSTSGSTIAFGLKSHVSEITSKTKNSEQGGVATGCDLNADGTVSDAERQGCRAAGSVDEWAEMSGSVVPADTVSGVIDSTDEMKSLNIKQIFDGAFGYGGITVAYDGTTDTTNNRPNPLLTVNGAFKQIIASGDNGNSYFVIYLDKDEFASRMVADSTMPGATLPSDAGFASVASGQVACPIIDGSCDPTTQFGKAACQTATNRPISCACMTAQTGSACSMTNDQVEHCSVTRTSAGERKFTHLASGSSTKFANAPYKLGTSTTVASSVETLTKSFGENAWDCEIPTGQNNPVTASDLQVLIDAGKMDDCIKLESDVAAAADKDSCFQSQGDEFAAKGKDAGANVSKSGPVGFACAASADCSGLSSYASSQTNGAATCPTSGVMKGRCTVTCPMGLAQECQGFSSFGTASCSSNVCVIGCTKDADCSTMGTALKKTATCDTTNSVCVAQ